MAIKVEESGLDDDDDPTAFIAGSSEETHRPEWVSAVLDLSAGLGPLQQEKEAPSAGGQKAPWNPDSDPSIAGFTCVRCPNPHRPVESKAQTAFLRPPWARLDTPCVSWVLVADDHATTHWTKRCTKCDTRFKKWTRAKADARQLEMLSDALQNVGLVFLTLTVPNTVMESGRVVSGKDRADSVRELKRDVAKWRRSVGVKGRFLGGIDYYEITEKTLQDGRVSLNPHVHCLWLQTAYWKQKEMQKSWGRGIVHIRKVKNIGKQVHYCTKYATKNPLSGVRAKERWGACRLTVSSAIEESRFSSSPVSADAELVSDEAGITASLVSHEQDDAQSTEINSGLRRSYGIRRLSSLIQVRYQVLRTWYRISLLRHLRLPQVVHHLAWLVMRQGRR